MFALFVVELEIRAAIDAFVDMDVASRLLMLVVNVVILSVVMVDCVTSCACVALSIAIFSCRGGCI